MPVVGDALGRHLLVAVKRSFFIVLQNSRLWIKLNRRLKIAFAVFITS